MILIKKGGLSRGDNEMPENCLYDCRLRDTCIYVPRWADEETLLRIGTERSKSCPLIQVYEVPKETEQAHTVMYDRKTEPTISKMEQVDKDINVRSKDCKTCKWGEWYRKGYDITMMDDECGGCCSWNSKWTPKDEPQSLEQFRVGLEYHTDTTHFGKVKGESIATNKNEEEPQRGLIACPIQEETAEYYEWLYEDEPQTDIGTSDTVYSDTAGYVLRADMTDCSWK